MYLVTALGITIGYHRLLTHRAFQTYKPVEYAFAAAGSMAVQGPVIDWVADHRKHHAHTDEEGDPHSPHVGHGSGLAGLWHAHVGWLFDTNGQADRRKYAPDLMDDRGMRLLNRRFLSLVGALAAGSRSRSAGCSPARSPAALTGLLWGGLVRIFFVHHITWSINSICHFHGRRRFATDDQSTNVWWLSLASLGEAWHHNHHAFPRSAVHGLRRWELDPSGAIIGADAEARPGLERGADQPERQAQRLATASARAERLAGQRTNQSARGNVRRGAVTTSTRSRTPGVRGARSASPNRRAIDPPMATWILTGSLENFRINVERGFDVVGFKERRRNQALEFEPGDEIVFYVTGVQAFGGIARVRSEMFEDREPIWPQGKKKHPEDYPWRVEAEPVVVLDESDFVPGRVAARRARAPAQVAGRALAPGLPGPAAHGLRGRREAARASGSPRPRSRRRRTGDPRAPLHRRGGERAAAAARADAARLREARDRLTDAEAHELLADAAPGNGGGAPGREVGEAFLEVRELLGEIQELGIVVRDIDRGLIDFPAILDGREVYLCWELDEDAIGFWHDLESGYGGRQPLELSRAAAPALSPAERIVAAGRDRGRRQPAAALVRDPVQPRPLGHRARQLRLRPRGAADHRRRRGRRGRGARRPGGLPPRPLRAAELVLVAGVWAALLTAYLMIDRPDELAGTTSVGLRSGSSSPSAAASRSSSEGCGCGSSAGRLTRSPESETGRPPGAPFRHMGGVLLSAAPRGEDAYPLIGRPRAELEPRTRAATKKSRSAVHGAPALASEVPPRKALRPPSGVIWGYGCSWRFAPVPERASPRCCHRYDTRAATSPRQPTWTFVLPSDQPRPRSDRIARGHARSRAASSASPSSSQRNSSTSSPATNSPPSGRISHQRTSFSRPLRSR